MDWLTSFILFSVMSRVQACVIDNGSIDTEWEKKLHMDLQKTYKQEETPRCNRTEVEIDVTMKYFKLNADSDIFSMYSWTKLSWVDERLKWDPTEYNNINETSFWSYDYWVPILKVQNSLESPDYGQFYGTCQLKSNGGVLCMSRITDEARCISVLTNWPYDSQNCVLEYGISSKQKNVILLPKYTRTISTLSAEYGTDWTIYGYHETRNFTDSVQLKISFILERNGEGLGAIIISPSILLTILSVATIFMDVVKLKRFWLTCFNVFCHFFFLTIISENIPKHTADSPTIVFFYRSSLLMTTFLVAISLGLKFLRNRGTSIPGWVISFNDFTLNSYGKHLIHPRWKTDEGLVNIDTVNVKVLDAWNDLANILNNVSLLVFVLAYVVLALLFIPRPPTFVY